MNVELRADHGDDIMDMENGGNNLCTSICNE